LSRLFFKSVKNSIITLLILGVLGLGFFLVLFGDSIIDQVRDIIIENIEEQVPFRISWDRMAIFPINNLVLEGVEVYTLEEEEPFFRGDRVVVGYSFWELILDRTSPAASVKRVSIERFELLAEDPLALIPELEEEDFRAAIQLFQGRGLVGWEGLSEELENISGSFLPAGERGWEGNLKFEMSRAPHSQLELSGYWEPGELEGRLELKEFPLSIAGEYLPDEQVRVQSGLVSGVFFLDYQDGQEVEYSGNFEVFSGNAWIAAIDETLEDFSGGIDFSQESVSVREGRAFLDETELNFSGKYFLPGEEFELTLDLKSLELAYIQGILEKAGFWEAEFPDISGRGDVSLNALGSLERPLVDAVFAISGGQFGPLAYSQLEGSLSYEGDGFDKNPLARVNLNIARGWTEEIEFSGLEAQLNFAGESFAENPLVELDFSLDQGQADDFEVSGLKGSMSYRAELWGENPFAELDFKIDYGQFQQLGFNQVQGMISYQDEFLSIHELRGEFAGGQFSLNGLVGTELLLAAEFSDVDPSRLPDDLPWPEEIDPRGNLGGEILLSGPWNDWDKISIAGDVRWENPRLAGMDFQEVEGVFWTGGEEIFFSPLIIRDNFGGLVEIQGTTDFNLQNFDFQLWASGIDIENYPLEENIFGKLDINGRLFGSLENPGFQGNFSGKNLVLREEELGEIEGRFAWENDRVQFEQVYLVHPWGQLDAWGTIDLSGDQPHTDLFVNAEGPCLSPLIEQLDIPLELWGEIKLALEIEGSFTDPTARGNIELTEGQFGDQPFDFLRTDFIWQEEKLEFSNLEARMAGGVLNGRGSFKLPEEIELELEGRHVALEEIREWEEFLPDVKGNASFSVSARGTLPDLQAEGFLRVESIMFADEYLGDIEGDFSFKEGMLELRDVVLRGQEGTYFIEGMAQILPPGELALELRTEEASLDRLLSVAGWDEFWVPLIPVTLAGELKVNGTIERPHIEISGSAFYPAGELEIVGGGYLDGPYEGKIEGPVDFDLISEFLPEDFEIQGQGEVEVLVNFDDAWEITGDNVFTEIAFNGVSFSEAGGNFSWKSGQPIYLEQRFLRISGETLEVKGFIPLEPQRPDLFLQVFTEGFDLGFLASFNPHLLSVGGKAMVDATISGSIDEPIIDGEGYLQEGSFRYFNFPGGVEEIEGKVVFAGNEMLMENVQSRYSEGGDLDLSGKIGFDGWEPDYYDLLLTIEQLHINHGTVDGYGDGEMTITGSYYEPEIVGYLDVYDTVIGIPFDWPHEEVEEEEQINPHFELAFRPAGNIRVRDGNFDVQVQSGELILDNRIGDLEMVGEVVSRQGNINFYNTNFRLLEGRARFLRFGESIPHISASAQTTVRDTQVFVYLDGSALDMNMRLVSQPPMDEQEIMDLLVYRGGLGDLLRGDIPGAFRQELWRIIGETFRTSFLVQLQTTIGDFLELDEFLITPILLGDEERIEFYVGKAITDRIYITYTQDFTARGSNREFSVEFRLRDNLFFSGSLQDEGHFQLGVEFNYPF